ncbi:MAG: hypothetical protein ACLFOY_01745 [Desulfatibacillaceae bacterium]
MREAFDEILSTKDVDGVILFSPEGELLFKEFNSEHMREVTGLDWNLLKGVLDDVREADLVYEHKRLYFRKTAWGNLVIVMGLFAPIAMVRLSCDLLAAPPEKQDADSRGFRRFFKRRK